MPIVGFNFTKILAEKHKALHGKISIRNNVSILSVDDAKLAMAQTKKGVRVKFLFESAYEPDLGTLQLEGDVIILEEAKVADALLKSWGKEKILPKEMMGGMLNHILERCNIQALILARDINLPAPIPLPKVTVQNATKPIPKAAKPAAKTKKKK